MSKLTSDSLLSYAARVQKLCIPKPPFIYIFIDHIVLLQAKKLGHQTSVSFEKFDVVQALLSFWL
jgi:hypothetical protein